MKIFVTGATGLIGSVLVRRLITEKHEVVVLQRKSADTREIDDLKLSFHLGDVTDPESLKGAMDGCDVVYHMAGFVAQWSGYKEALYKVNTLGVRYVLEAALAQGVKRVVVASSTAAIGGTKHPEILDEKFLFNLGHLPYAHSKWLGEKEAIAVAKKGIEVVIVNPATTFGPGDKHLNAGRTILNARDGKIFGFPPGGNSFVDVGDVVDGIIAAMEKGRNLERYILTNEILSYKTLLEIIAKIQGQLPPKLRLPKFFLVMGGWGKEMISRCLFSGEPYPSREAVDMSIRFMYCSSNKAQRELGYNPKVSMEDSIQMAYDWYIKQDFKQPAFSRIQKSIN